MADSRNDCFVIMPVTDPDSYEKGHFQHVYEDIICPACEAAQYNAIRANDVLQTNLIHLDILKKLIDTPMAICDLSGRNPNVLFELGLRQAFDKPVVLIQEKGTPRIFDIAPLRFTEYRKERIYHEVLEDQKNIAAAVEATANATRQGDGINSIVNLLSLTAPAALKEFRQEESTPMLQIVMAEMGALRHEVRDAIRNIDRRVDRPAAMSARLNVVRRMLAEAEALILEGDESSSALQRGLSVCEDCQLAASEFEDRRFPPSVRAEARHIREKASALAQHGTHAMHKRVEAKHVEWRASSEG